MRNSNLNGKQCRVDSNLDLKSRSLSIPPLLIHILHYPTSGQVIFSIVNAFFFFLAATFFPTQVIHIQESICLYYSAHLSSKLVIHLVVFCTHCVLEEV